jgi:ABC-type glycerol-3-phosphate transport system permease component
MRSRGRFQNNKINPQSFGWSQLKFFVVLIPLSLLLLLPIVFMFSTAFKPADELFVFPPRLFVLNPTLDNFTRLFKAMSTSAVPASRYLFNSILVALCTVTLSILLSVSAAYILSKKDFPGKDFLFDLNTLAIEFVPIAVSVPTFIIISRLGLTNLFITNILPIIAMPVGLFLMKQFVDQIPDSLIEAAYLDGASEMDIVFKVVVPMTKPAIATIAILSFQSAWGNVVASNLYITNESFKTFAYYITSFTSSNTSGVGQGMAAAAALIMFVPNLIIFIFMQSQVMDTMAYSGIK